ncbi:hypothetical protein EDC94DRAFT_585386 [Helicostylum pulchrum]|nr:hypothetical protein EDC94DRAFT_585386 [Helicostylum pulchrum]
MCISFKRSFFLWYDGANEYSSLKTGITTVKQISLWKKALPYYLQKQVGQEQISHLFSLFPAPSLKWRFISVNPDALAAFAGLTIPSDYATKLDMSLKVFNFKKLTIDSLRDLKNPNRKKKKIAFRKFIRSDGFSADVDEIGQFFNNIQTDAGTVEFSPVFLRLQKDVKIIRPKTNWIVVGVNFTAKYLS